jgi:Tfp pilus assembly protein PilF
VLAPALVLAAASVAASPAGWGLARARSGHFEVLTDAGEPLARHAALRLERLRAVLLQLFPPRLDDERRIVAIVLASGARFEALVPRRHQKPDRVEGFFQGCGVWDAIVARISAEPRGAFAALDHEYAHVALNRSLPAQPLWVSEGLAELLSGGELDGGEARFGMGEPEPEQGVREQPVPLAKLLELRLDSPEYLGAAPNAGLYPAAWALARWTLARRGLSGLRSFLEAVALGQEPDAAFAATLAPLREAQATLLELPEDPVLRVTLATPGAPAEPQLDAPSVAETGQLLGELLLREGELDRSQALLERALADAPDSAAVRVSLAELRLQKGESALARRELERALVVAPDDPGALLYDARMRVAEARAAGVPLEPRLEERLVSQLERALGRAPDLYEAALLLVELRPEPYAERRKALEPVFEHDPSRTEVALAIASLDRKERDLSAAERVLRRAREAASEPAYRFLCDRELGEIAEFQAATVELRGRLIHLECRPDGSLRFTVDAPPAPVLLEADSSRSFLVYGSADTGGASGESELVCGLQDRPIVVRYERLPRPEGGLRAEGAAEGRVLWLSLPAPQTPARHRRTPSSTRSTQRPPSR